MESADRKSSPEVLLTSESRVIADSDGVFLAQGEISFLRPLLREVHLVSLILREDGAPNSPILNFGALSTSRIRTVPVLRANARLPGHLWTWAAEIWKAVGDVDAVVALQPGQVGSVTALVARIRRRPLGVVVVGDPWEALSPSSTRHPARRAFRPILTASQRWSCWAATTTLYVTERTLQAAYPPRAGAPTFVATNAQVAAVKEPRRHPKAGPVRLLTVASMEQPYKGIDYLISAVRILQQRGIGVTLRVVGDGRLRSRYEALAREKVGHAAVFVGQLPSDSLELEYDASDIFVLASLTEGLPRVLVEAMAHGLPCVATRVEGSPSSWLRTVSYCPGTPATSRGASSSWQLPQRSMRSTLPPTSDESRSSSGQILLVSGARSSPLWLQLRPSGAAPPCRLRLRGAGAIDRRPPATA